MLDRAGKTAEAESAEERFPTEEPVEATTPTDLEEPEDDIPF